MTTALVIGGIVLGAIAGAIGGVWYMAQKMMDGWR